MVLILPNLWSYKIKYNFITLIGRRKCPEDGASEIFITSLSVAKGCGKVQWMSKSVSFTGISCKEY